MKKYTQLVDTLKDLEIKIFLNKFCFVKKKSNLENKKVKISNFNLQ